MLSLIESLLRHRLLHPLHHNRRRQAWSRRSFIIHDRVENVDHSLGAVYCLKADYWGGSVANDYYLSLVKTMLILATPAQLWNLIRLALSAGLPAEPAT